MPGMTWLVRGRPIDSMEYWYGLYCQTPLCHRSSGSWVDWLDKQVKVGTVKVFSTNEELEFLT